MLDAKVNNGPDSGTLDEALYRTIVENSGFMICRSGPDGALTFVNEIYCSYFGRSRQELLGKSFFTLIPEEEHERVRLTFPPRATGCVSHTHKVIRGDGAIRWNEWTISAVRDENGNLIEYQSIGWDVHERMSSMERFKAAEFLVQTVLDVAPAPIFINDAEGRILRVNQAWEKCTGIPVAEAQGRRLADILPVRTAEMLLGKIRAVLESSAPVYEVDDLDLPLGRRVFETVKFRLHDSERESPVVCGIGLDVTPRVIFEEALLERDRSHQLLVDGMLHTFAVYEVDRDGAGRAVDLRIKDANKAFADHARRPLSELIGKTIGEIYGKPMEKEWLDAFADVAAGGEPIRFERLSALSHRWLEGGAYSPKAGQVAISALDISARKQADEELRAAKELLQAIVEGSPVAIVAFDCEGIVQLWNPAAERLFGWTKEEAIGKLARWVPPDKWHEFEATKARLLRGESITNIQVERWRKEGSRVQVRFFTAPLRGRDGSIAGATTLMEDVSEREELLQQIRQAQKLESVGRLAGGIAHDFNNLLTVINGYTQLALARLSPVDSLHTQLSEVLNAGERAASLTQQLLAFSRKQVLAPRRLQFRDVITATGQMLRHTLGDDIRWETELDSECDHVHADEGQLIQVILNLAVNARDAMPDGGALRIRLANVVSPAPDLPGVPAGRWVEMEVTDTGVGMDEGVQSHIFEPFFTTKEPGRGTGLGLSTVYGIVQQSGGRILVRSRPGQGTTFRVLLPSCDSDAIAAQAVTKDPGLPVGGHETILLVEDRPELLTLSEEILSGLGYRVLPAGDGQEALRLARAHSDGIQLLISDVVMPGLRGDELARLLKKDRERMRVLFLSGYPDIGQGTTRDGLAGTRLLSKPFTPSALARAVREVLDADAAV